MTSNICKRRLLLHFRVTFFCCQVLKRDLPDTRQWSNLARRSFDYMLTLQSGMYRCLIITARGLYATPAGALLSDSPTVRIPMGGYCSTVPG